MTDHLLQEVDSALRADRAALWWSRYRRWIVLSVAGLILSVAAHSAWQHYAELRGGKMLVRLMAAQTLLEKGEAAAAAEGFAAVAAQAGGDLRALAYTWQARALQADGKGEEALTVLAKAAAEGSGLWSDIACLRLAGLDVVAAKPCLSADKRSPLAQDRAVVTIAQNWSIGEKAQARAGLEKLLADSGLDEATRQRLESWRTAMKAHP